MDSTYSRLLIAGLAVGESIILPRPGKGRYRGKFHRMARRRGMRVSVRKIDDATVPITRIN